MNDPLEAVALTAGYRTGRPPIEVVRDLSARLRPGEFACLIGINGAGKSTLLRTLAALQPALAGRVLIEGTPMLELSRDQRARKLALVLTERVSARHLSGLDVVRLGRHPYTGWNGRLSAGDHDAVDQAIAATRCDDLVSRPVASMSDGERQRVMIARAVAQAPRVMLLDEPTAFLDIAHRIRLTALLRDLTHTERIAVLMSTHDLELALRTADTIWLIRASGELVTAPPEDVALSGILSEEFSDDRLAFEHEAGGFRISPLAERGRLSVSGGEGAVRLWTIRAISRLGYDPVVVEGAAAADVRIEGDRWHVRSGGVATSIAELITHLDAAAARVSDDRPRPAAARAP